MSLIFLVGFMGCGKSTVGQQVARNLGWAFHDTDTMVEAAQGRSIPEIFRDAGEGRFREAEWDALCSLEGVRRAVVATGGGLFAGRLQREWIRVRGRSVWIDAPLALCRSRVLGGPDSDRPLWSRRDPVGLRILFERRRAVYALADCRVDGRGTAQAVAAGVLERSRRFFVDFCP